MTPNLRIKSYEGFSSGFVVEFLLSSNDFSALSAVLGLALEATFFAGLRVVFLGL
jgi:hypothetical protein